MMNNKGQVQSIIVFFVLIVAILITSIIVLRIVNEVVTPLKVIINNTNEQAGSSINYAQERFTTFWDYAIILLICVNVVILLISSFMVDVHPIFLILYIIAVICLFTFGNLALTSLDNIWGLMGTSTETAQTPLQQFLINNFNIIMLSIIVLSGIIMYGKFRLGSQTGAGAGGNY